MQVGVNFHGIGILPLLFFAGALTLVIFYFLFKFANMSSAPFKSMKAVYVYIAALIGLVIVSTGVYGLLEYLLSVLFLNATFDAAYIITPLTRIITGLFVMIPHWAIGHHFHALEHKRGK
ncbi:hypothetical protein KAI54_03685 [Candidatus Gracilibacteria bacterium]|nr:hypothetical protein [Candidatus Gracilibacteria bacterium]